MPTSSASQGCAGVDRARPSRANSVGPSLLRPILVRAASLGAVLVIVLVLLVLTLGATGYSDRILSAQVGEELRALRTSLSQTVTDPAAVEEAIEARRTELEAS